jgi:hypothetical protein
MLLLDLTDQMVRINPCLVLGDQKDPTLQRLQMDPKDQIRLILCLGLPKDPTRQRDRTLPTVQMPQRDLTRQRDLILRWVLELNF